MTAVSISGTQIILTTGNASTYGESLALGYTPGLNPIRDRSFNDAISFTGYAILNMNISSSGGSSGGRVTPLTTAGNPTANYPMECPRNTSGNVYRKNTLDYNPQTFLDFANNLVLEGFITRQDNVNEYRFTDKMLRKDALRIGVKMKRNKGEDVGLVSPQKYTKIYSDIDYTSTSWLPGTIETGLAYDLISKERETFEQNRSVTRSETYAMIMKSVCMLGHTSSSLVDWQYNVYNIASSNGLTIRSWSDFEPNREILTQEIFVLASRAADWAEKTGGCNPLPKQCLLP